MRLEHLDSKFPLTETHELPEDDLLLISLAYPIEQGLIHSVDYVAEQPEVKEYVSRINDWMNLFNRANPRSIELDSALFEEIQCLLIEKIIEERRTPVGLGKESKAKMFIWHCWRAFEKGTKNNRPFNLNELLLYAANNQVDGYSPISVNGDNVYWIDGSSTKKALRRWFVKTKKNR